ncbi:hypothetical protein HZH68_010163 [Vespula germanica]|uniref:Endonuclease/exonuclease/phosphatase domain-containing protein n=1 Tax=Vespula germanica TaxID=30212 RepID=A0A834JUS1_VESGE|nr:hypothetical protein HZH68_010163 [Vespula germanica]
MFIQFQETFTNLRKTHSFPTQFFDIYTIASVYFPCSKEIQMEMKQNIQPIMGNDYVQQKINRIISDIRMQVDLCEIIETDVEISIISRMKYIIAGDFNAKHTDWGSRLVTARGFVIRNIIEVRNSKLQNTKHMYEQENLVENYQEPQNTTPKISISSWNDRNGERISNPTKILKGAHCIQLGIYTNSRNPSY